MSRRGIEFDAQEASILEKVFWTLFQMEKGIGALVLKVEIDCMPTNQKGQSITELR